MQRIPAKEIVPRDNRPLAHKDYDKILVEYVNQNLKEYEIGVYRAFYDAIVSKYKIKEANELMLLDMVCYDFVRIKRLQKMITDEGDVIKSSFMSRGGQKIDVRKVHEASYLLNAIESQFRNTMKELLLTRKEQAKIAIGKEPQSFDQWIKDNVVEVEKEEVKK